MKKFFNVSIKTAGALCAALLVAACFSPLQTARKGGGEALTAGTGRVVISTGAAGARTALPDAVNDLIYTAEWETSDLGLDGEAIAGGSQELAGDDGRRREGSLVLPSEVDWAVTINAYARGADGEAGALVAQASLGIIRLEDFQLLEFHGVFLSPCGGEPGTFNWSVSFPPAGITSAKLFYNDGEDKEINLLEGAGGVLSLAPGFYQFRAELEAANGLKAGGMEIVYVYPGMQTSRSWLFAADDFKDTTELTAVLEVDPSESVVIQNLEFEAEGFSVEFAGKDGNEYVFIVQEVPVKDDTLGKVTVTITTENNVLTAEFEDAAIDLDGMLDIGGPLAINQLLLSIETDGYPDASGNGTLAVLAEGKAGSGTGYSDYTAATAGSLETVTIDLFTGGEITVQAHAQAPDAFGGWIVPPEVTEKEDSTDYDADPVGEGALAFAMPACNIEVKAEIKAKKYMVMVMGGTGGGDYAPGATVEVALTDRTGAFLHWMTGMSGPVMEDNVGFADNESETTTFIMPAEDVHVMAHVQKPKVRFGQTSLEVVFREAGSAKIEQILVDSAEGYIYNNGGGANYGGSRIDFTVDMEDAVRNVTPAITPDLEHFYQVSYRLEEVGSAAAAKRTALAAGSPLPAGTAANTQLGGLLADGANAGDYLMTAVLAADNYTGGSQLMTFPVITAQAEKTGSLVDFSILVNAEAGKSYQISGIVFELRENVGIPMIANVPNSVIAGATNALPQLYDSNGADVAPGAPIVWTVKSGQGIMSNSGSAYSLIGANGPIVLTASIALDGGGTVDRDFTVSVNDSAMTVMATNVGVGVNLPAKDAYNNDITWTVTGSNAGVITEGPGQRMYGRASGSATLTASTRIGTFTHTCTHTINIAAATAVTPISGTVYAGQLYSLAANYNSGPYGNRPIAWTQTSTSSNRQTVTGSPTRFWANAAGSGNLTARINVAGIGDITLGTTYGVTVVEANFSAPFTTMTAGTSQARTTTGTYNGQALSWTVGAAGTASAQLNTGTNFFWAQNGNGGTWTLRGTVTNPAGVTITAYYRDFTVNVNPLPVTGVPATMYAGQAYTLPSTDGSSRAITWSVPSSAGNSAANLQRPATGSVAGRLFATGPATGTAAASVRASVTPSGAPGAVLRDFNITVSPINITVGPWHTGPYSDLLPQETRVLWPTHWNYINGTLGHYATWSSPPEFTNPHNLTLFPNFSGVDGSVIYIGFTPDSYTTTGNTRWERKGGSSDTLLISASLAGMIIQRHGSVTMRPVIDWTSSNYIQGVTGVTFGPEFTIDWGGTGQGNANFVGDGIGKSIWVNPQATSASYTINSSSSVTINASGSYDERNFVYFAVDIGKGKSLNAYSQISFQIQIAGTTFSPAVRLMAKQDPFGNYDANGTANGVKVIGSIDRAAGGPYTHVHQIPAGTGITGDINSGWAYFCIYVHGNGTFSYTVSNFKIE